MAEQYNTYRCPMCGKRLFDASADSEFRIRIKCPQCRNIVEIDSNAGIKHQALALLPKNNDFRKCG